MNASGKWLVVGIIVVVGIGGGVLLLRNTNHPAERDPASQDKSQTPSSNETVGQPSLEMPVPGSNVEETVVTSGKEVEVTVEGSNYKFNPATIKAEKGDTVRLTFKSVGGIHDLTIDEFEVQTSQLGDEEEEETEFVADKTGTFEYYCSVGNHRKMGMTGQLIVE